MKTETDTANHKTAYKHAFLVLLGYALLYALFFSPVLFSNRILAPGDGISYFLPSYYVRTLFWDASVWGGFPSVADAPRMLWYPPALLLRLLPRSWDLFLLSAYLIGSCFTYGYVFALTRSRLGAMLSGLIYGLCGFMIAHLGHAALIHTVAWLPLIVWSMEQLALGEKRFWFLAGTFGIACAALAGHPQMFVYVVALTAAYAVVTGWRMDHRWNYFVTCALMFVFGVGLAAVQLIPTAELSRLSLRATLTFPEFVAYQLPLRQLPMLLFPFIYGGSPGSFYGIGYFGAWPSSADGWGASELTGYVGLLPLVLSVVGVMSNRRRGVVLFWSAIAIIAILLAVGESTPLARLIYHLPVLNKFRAPARYLFAFSLGVSVLAGFGVQALQRRQITQRQLTRVMGGFALLILVVFIAVNIFANKVNELALQRLGHAVSLSPFRNPAIFVPPLLFVLAVLVLLYWNRRHDKVWLSVLLVGMVIVELASFGWFYEWRYRSPFTAYLRAPAAATNYGAQLAETNQRLLPVRGGTGKVSELPPNLSKLWRLPSTSGYGPLILERVSRMLTMPPHGSVDESWRDPANRGLDLMATRFVLVPEAGIDPPAYIDERGLRWSTSELPNVIGPGCAATLPATTEITPPNPLRATRLGLVGALACSVALENEEVASVSVTDTKGSSRNYSLTAGRDFSEWAYDCSDVRPVIKHDRASVFRSYPAQRGDIRCEGHDYVSLITLGGSQEIAKISVRWTGRPGTLAIKRVTLIDDDARLSVPINPVPGSLNDASRWRHVGEINKANSGYGAEVSAGDLGSAHVYENLRALPRVWLTGEVMTVSEEQAFTAIRSSQLPDGRTFDPLQTALVEEAVPLAKGAAGSARVTALSNDVMEVGTNSPSAAFLITSDVHYPGWRATVDGTPATIYRADFALRGVVVPAGSHIVRFEYHPSSFRLGLIVSIASLVLLLVSAVGFGYWVSRAGGAGMRAQEINPG